MILSLTPSPYLRSVSYAPRPCFSNQGVNLVTNAIETMRDVYLQFGGAFCGIPNGPFQTVKVEWKESPLWWQERGLSYTASGYGRRIPSRYMVKHNGRWRRVYICQYGNAGTAYIGPSNAPIATVDGPY